MPLVSDADIYAHLDLVALDDDPDGVVTDIRDGIEELLATTTGQEFSATSVTKTNEVYDGTGLHTLYTRSPIKTLTAISFRYAPEVVQESFYSLDITDGVTFTVGKRRLYSRVVRFPGGFDNVLVSYATQPNAPQIAILAVKEATAAIYRGRGSEDARSEQKGTFQHVLIRKMDELKFWPKALELLQVPSIG